jgi:hypothetical protein
MPRAERARGAVDEPTWMSAMTPGQQREFLMNCMPPEAI